MPQMQNNSAGSFIPESSATVTPPDSKKPTRSGGVTDVVLLVAIIMLASSLAISSAVFLYSKLVNTQLQDQKESLNRIRNAIDKRTIENLKLLSKKLSAGDDILNKHIAVSELFRALEQITLKSVQFTTFSFQMTPPDEIKLLLSGKALTVNAVAAQSKAFAANNDKFQNVVFSDLGFEKDGTVSFKVSADINPDFINFVNLVLTRVNEGNITTSNMQSGADSGGADIFSQDTAQGEEAQTDEFGNLINN